MTKLQEICTLKEAITAFGKDSYLGPALSYLLSWIEQEIRSDHEPSLTDQLEYIKRDVAEKQAIQQQLDKDILTARATLKVIDESVIHATRRLDKVREEVGAVYNCLRPRT